MGRPSSAYLNCMDEHRGWIGERWAPMIEIEGKFQIPDADTFQRLLSVSRLGEYSCDDPEHIQVLDRYYDTEDLSLLRDGYACRLRSEGDRTLVTIKGLGEVVDGVHRRQELEEVISGDVDPRTWPAGPARELVLRRIGERPLIPLVELHQARARRRIHRAGHAVGILSLDRTMARSAGHTLTWWELEIELHREDDLADLKRLSQILQSLFALRPEAESKFLRAWRWARSLRG